MLPRKIWIIGPLFGKAWNTALNKAGSKPLASQIGGAHHLESMREYATYLPSVNQIEINPWLQRPELRAATEAVGESHGLFTIGKRTQLDDPDLIEIAERLGCTPPKSPSSSAMTWDVSLSQNPVEDRIIENLASLNVDLSSEQDSLAAMECGYISGWDPTSEP